MTTESNSETLYIGLGKTDITPPIGAALIGYKSRISTSLDLPLYAEVLVCRKGDNAWALV
ncbi:MAG: hypothetical protein HRU15_09450, partial [Planctomycetes bacterium]|nr:hypothetical protein [Planctomycetota bacterium]